MTFQGECLAWERKAALIAGQREKPAMASLRKEQHYGLSCGKNSRTSSNRTLYHVKLTDTALRALEAYQNLKVYLFLKCVCARACVRSWIQSCQSCRLEFVFLFSFFLSFLFCCYKKDKLSLWHLVKLLGKLVIVSACYKQMNKWNK